MDLRLVTTKRWYVAGSVAVAAMVATGISLPRKAPAQAPRLYLVVRQSSGPVGIGRNQSALIGLLLPAVQKVREAAARVKIRFYNAESGKLLGEKVVDLQRGGGGTFFKLTITADGSVFVGDGTAAVMRLGENQMSLPVVGQLIGLLRPGATTSLGDVAGSLQVGEPGSAVHTVVPFNFLPAVQMGDGSV